MKNLYKINNKKMKKDPKSIANKRECGCGKLFVYRSGLSRHIKQKHNGLAPKKTKIFKSGRPTKKPKTR